MNAIESRRALLRNIQEHRTVEVNTEFLLAEVFSDDLLIPVWCEAVGCFYEVNASPLPEFKSRTTIIFTDKNCKDSEL